MSFRHVTGSQGLSHRACLGPDTRFLFCMWPPAVPSPVDPAQALVPPAPPPPAPPGPGGLAVTLTWDALREGPSSKESGGRLLAEPLQQAVPLVHPAGRANTVSLPFTPPHLRGARWMTSGCKMKQGKKLPRSGRVPRFWAAPPVRSRCYPALGA